MCHLRIIGKLKSEDIHLLEQKNISYSNDYSLTNDEIIEEYQNCDMVSFPSLFEGFGAPIVEYQVMGRVMLTSNIPPMTEVACDAAVYVNLFTLNQYGTDF
jgi:glycosyltransferase involved in cell wall biosynthesis